MNKQEFNGKTLDEALSAAARALGTDVTLISYNILPQNSGGLFSKLFQRGVRLEAWVDTNNDVQAAAREAVRQARADAQDQTKPRPAQRDRSAQNQKGPTSRGAEPRREGQGPRPQKTTAPQDRGQTERTKPGFNQSRPERSSQQRPARNESRQPESTEFSERPRVALTSQNSKDLLKELALQFVKGFDPEVAAPSAELEFINDEEVIVTVVAPNLEQFLIRSDRLSCAFEHLFKRIAQRKFGDISGRVALNAGGAAQLREDKLKQMALDIAAKVKENGKTITLSSKSSQERRVIHLALENMEGIATKSVGVGDNRKLIVYSTDRPQRNNQNSRRHRGGRHQNRSDANQNNLEASAVSGEESQGEPSAGGNDGQPRRPRRRGRRGGARHNRQGGQSRNQLDAPTPVGASFNEKTRDSDV